MKKVRQTIKKIISKVKGRRIINLTTIMLLAPKIVLAASSDGVTEWNSIIDFFCTWITRAGIAYLIYGGLQIAKAYKTHNPDAKDDGVDNCVTACMTIAIPQIVKAIAG